MTFGAEVWGPALISALGSLGAGYLSGQGSADKETKMQRTKRKLVDQLLASLNGEGPYSDLFNSNEEAFQKSFVDPAKSLFKNQIAPQIQQQYIASGQQRSSGLDDQLLRAGVDLDSMLNQYLYQSQQDTLNRKYNTLNSILGSDSGSPNETSGYQDIMSALSGYLSSEGFSDFASNLFKNNTNNNGTPQRKGFENQ